MDARRVIFSEMASLRVIPRSVVVVALTALSLALCANGFAAARADVTLKLGRSYVGGIYPREFAVGTVTVTPPPRWSFVRNQIFGAAALYSIPVTSAACVPQGELRVVGVQATGADPLIVAQRHAFKGVIASGRLHSGAWAVLRYRTTPSSVRAMLGGIAVLRVAPRRLLTVQARLHSTCDIPDADLNRIAGELGKAARSTHAQVHVRRPRS